jgi:peptidoglycan/LPS O-acetylase OafA/YrhL
MTAEAGGDFSKAWSSMWPAFFHIQNFVESGRVQLWSLAVEEHFYLALPVLLWLLTRGRRGANALEIIPRICLALSISCFVLRVWVAATTDIYVRERTDFSFDALFFGVNLAYLRAARPKILLAIAQRSRWVVPFVWLFFLPGFINGASFWSERAHKVWQEIAFTGAYLAYALLLVCFVLGEPSAWLKRWLGSRSARCIAIIGTSSYSIYIWHVDTTWWAYEATLSAGRKLGLPTELTWLLHTAAYVAAAVVSGIILGHLIETPALRLRDRIFPSRTAPVTQAPG